MIPDETALPLNETLKTIKDRRSIRLFTKQDVPDDHIQTILRAANEAPSATIFNPGGLWS